MRVYSRITLKELGILLLLSFCWLAMLQCALRRMINGEYINMCIEGLGTIGWLIVYKTYQKKLRNKYKK